MKLEGPLPLVQPAAVACGSSQTDFDPGAYGAGGGPTAAGLDWVAGISAYERRGENLYFAEFDRPGISDGVAHHRDGERFFEFGDHERRRQHPQLVAARRRRALGPAAAGSALTVDGAILGTPQYMAPEQARGEIKQLDRRADVYGLGATLYALLTGKAPIDGDNPLVVLNRISIDEPPRPRTLDRDLPLDLEAIVMKCLEKDRGQRYDSARALADDLGRFLDGAPVQARASAGLGYRLRKTVRRHWRALAVAVA